MKILIIDRDETLASLLKSKLGPMGYDVRHEPVKDNAIKKLEAEAYGIVFIDPSPLTSARPLVVNIRRMGREYPYIFLTSGSFSQEEAIKSGVNDLIEKPFDMASFQKKMENAERFRKLVLQIGDDSRDFPSAGGVIAKSAFNQLFLSAIERADRYGEKSCVLFISLGNYQQLVETVGHYDADYAVARLSKNLVNLRRQSDIIGQTAKNEYALLLQRPSYETEPLEAASRFADSLNRMKDNDPSSPAGIEIKISLIELPTGAELAHYVVKPGNSVE